MAKNNILISVLLPSYNHAKYIRKTIDSILKQSFSNFELLISDDVSTDDSLKIIKSYTDPRIKVIVPPKNTGGLIFNELLKLAKGEFIAIINSDDYWESPLKLEKQLKVFENNTNIGACFTHINLIDTKGKKYSEATQKNCVFNQKNKSQAELFKYFFDKENCLCISSTLFRKKLYQKVGEFNHNYGQLADYDLWIRFIKEQSIYVIGERLTSFRYTNKNQSNLTMKNMRRISNERLLILLNFFDNASQKIIENAFKDRLIIKKISSMRHLEIEKAFLILKKPTREKKTHLLAAIIILNQLMKDKKTEDILANEYNFTDLDMQKILSEHTFVLNKYLYYTFITLSFLKKIPFLRHIKNYLLTRT